MSTFVIRPGETDFDLQDRVQGTLDLPLNTRGAAQVEQIVDQLKTTDLDVIYASPTEPAFSTAQRLGEALDIPVKALPSLQNVDLGLWQGMSYGEIRQKQPRVYRQWEESPETVCPPLGEPLAEAQSRVTRALRKPLRRGGDYAIVASEPLATLVASILKQERPQLSCPHAYFDSHSRVEQIGGETPVGIALAGGWARQ